MSDFNGHETLYPQQFRTFGKEDEVPVKQDYDLTLSILEDYFKKEDIQNGVFFTQFKDYKERNLNYDTEVFSTLLQHLANEKLFKDNKALYSEVAIFLEYASGKNLLHRNRKEHYENFMKIALFEDNKNSINSEDSESLIALDYSQYESDNFRVTDANIVINAIYENGGTIFLDSDGKICCRFSKNSKLKNYSKRQAEMILSKTLKYAIKITEEIPVETDMDIDLSSLSNAKDVDVDDEK